MPQLINVKLIKVEQKIYRCRTHEEMDLHSAKMESDGWQYKDGTSGYEKGFYVDMIWEKEVEE